MSNTAYQRSMADMKAAGLNPMLAYAQGGASTPTPSIPTVNSETKSKLGEFAMSSATGLKNSGIAQQQADTSRAATESSINLNKISAAKQVAETEQTRAKTEIIKKDIPLANLKHDMSQKATSLIRQLMDGVKNAARPSKPANVTPAQQKDMDGKIKQMKRYMK
jgi:hypothetical protein